MKTVFSIIAAAIMFAVLAPQAQAGLIVTGTEVGPNGGGGFDYKLTFTHDGGAAEPVLIPVGGFGITFNLTGITPDFASFGGSLVDGVTPNTISAGLSSWGGALGVNFDPNQIASGTMLTFSAPNSLGGDFSSVGWNFGALNFISGTVQNPSGGGGGGGGGGVVPEPSSLAIFLVGLAGVAGVRRRRRAA